MTVEKKKAVTPELLDSLLADYKKPEDLIWLKVAKGARHALKVGIRP